MRRGGFGLVVLCAWLAGCAGDGLGPGYYLQAARGQFDLWRRATPVAELLADPATPPVLRERLMQAQAMRRFASTALGLPDNASYASYADLQRPAVVWNVFAAPALSLAPRTWCFPVAGCVGYLGYFNEQDARLRAEALRAQGLDVYVGPVPAYSTLGWFADPLLNTFIEWPEAELARLIFHELAHQQLYVKDDTEFNESFATAVELAGVRRWLAPAEKASALVAFERGRARQAEFAQLVAATRPRFEALYAEAQAALAAPGADQAGLTQVFLARKAALVASVQAEYRTLRDTRWGGWGGYDGWFADLDNARLAATGFYSALVPGFEALLAREGGDMQRFYAAVERIAALPPAERRAALAP